MTEEEIAGKMDVQDEVLEKPIERGEVAQEEVAIEDLLHTELMLFDVVVDSKEELIRVLANRAEQAGFVEPGYAEDVIERERQFPTGLPTVGLKVAVPHAMTQEHVNKPAIVTARLAQPVLFKEMGAGVADVPVELVFMLVAKGDKQHLAVLQKLISLLSDPEALRVLGTLTEPDELMRELTDRLT
ncbi:PTS sugar transporter subunit IIA [Collinsella sp. AGMB00827]|uniref:PTS sugar transporter subunit IIA n=1 Tax=Collinsella ureilytica TaxID=2869515 RepID=A0ABS7MLJ8_9ACTN|nr:PTS sugar transporter subunit IIA [Collinsella urealyticum]MBY4798239.1 PTS sugar transporter subunit IIA [Collinsella urealyticum]